MWLDKRLIIQQRVFNVTAILFQLNNSGVPWPSRPTKMQASNFTVLCFRFTKNHKWQYSPYIFCMQEEIIGFRRLNGLKGLEVPKFSILSHEYLKYVEICQL